MVFKKQLNENGVYVDKDGIHYDVLSCERTETKEWYETGEFTEEGVPVIASRIVINKGWDSFPSLEDALESYGLTLEEEK